MPHDAAFHLDLYCLLKYSIRSYLRVIIVKKVQVLQCISDSSKMQKPNQALNVHQALYKSDNFKIKVNTEHIMLSFSCVIYTILYYYINGLSHATLHWFDFLADCGSWCRSARLNESWPSVCY